MHTHTTTSVLIRVLICLFLLPLTFHTSKAQFRLDAITPNPHQNNVPRNAIIEFSFSEAVSSGQINASFLRIRGEFSGTIAGSFSGTASISFTPTRPFPPGELILIDIPANLISGNANTIDQPYHYEFRTSNEAQGSRFFLPRVIDGELGRPLGLFTGDLDNDGDYDVATCTTLGNEIIIFNNDGDQNFSKDVIRVGANTPRDIYARDFNEDGQFDIIVGSGTTADNALIHLYDSESNYAQRTVASVNGLTLGIHAGDIDGNGELDIVGSSFFDNSIYWYQNTGGLNFSPELIDAGVSQANYSYTTDLDLDGDMDLLLSALGDDRVYWYENIGGTSFIRRVVASLNDPVYIYPVDLDDDGNLDVLVTGISGGGIRAYINDGAQNFSEIMVDNSVLTSYCVYPGDMDGDGDLDLVANSDDQGSIIWYQNEGLSFTKFVIDADAQGGRRISVIDMDQDGDLDVVSTSIDDGDLMWYENTTFEVSGISPGAGSNFNSPNTDILIDFTLNVSGSSLNKSNITVWGDQSGLLDGTYSGGGTQIIRFNPQQDFFPGELVTVQVNTSISSTTAISLTKAFQYTFRVRSGTSDQNPPDFAKRVISDQLQTPRGVYSVDLDEDGHLDLISTSLSNDQILWYRNNGNFTFTENMLTSDASRPWSIFPMDVDLDDDIDLIVANIGTDRIDWFENDGNENFDRRPITSTVGNPFSVYGGDLDGDGDQDLISSSFNNDQIAWYENDGNENFTSRVISTSGNGPQFVYARDMDGDGDLDVIAASSLDNEINLYENDGRGNFSTYQVSNNVAGARMVIPTDLDQDGDMDLLTAGEGSGGTLKWFENNGLGIFSERVISSSLSGAVSLQVADAEGDGDMDIYIASFGNDQINLFRNNGDQTFNQLTIDNQIQGPWWIYPADIDGDNDMDLLVSDFEKGELIVYENGIPLELLSTSPSRKQANVAVNASIRFNFNRNVSAAFLNANFFKIRGENTGRISGSFSGGGTNTIIFNPDADFKAGEVIYVDVLKGIQGTSGSYLDKSSHFEFRTDVAASPNNPARFQENVISTNANGANQVLTIDFDKDGDMDVLSISEDDDRIFWYENNGAQNFSERLITDQAGEVQSIYVIDINGDGDLDVVSANFGDNEINWYENDGSMNFSMTQVTNQAMGAQSVYAIDLDLDNDVDLLTVSRTDNEINWFENDGNEVFTENLISNQANRAERVYAVDMDDDGDIDVLSASFQDNKIAWYENDGCQNFTERVISTQANGAKDVYAIDLNQDGSMDVLSASLNDNTIAWYQNNGSQTFTKRNISTNAQQAASVYAADVDGDGNLDVLSASQDDNSITWYQNDGAQNFTAFPISSLAQSARSVYAADMDGDGDLDVLSASNDDNKIAWYENVFVDDPPVVQNPVADQVLDEDDSRRGVFIRNVFTDPDNDDDAIVITVQNNGAAVISANITGDSLFITPNPDASGTAELILTGSSNGQNARDTLNVIVNPIDDPPFVLNPLNDFSINEDSPGVNTFIRDIFSDLDNDDNAINITVQNNSISILTAAIVGDSLFVQPLPDATGTGELILIASSNGLDTRDTVIVSVIPTDDPPFVQNALSDIMIDEDDPRFGVYVRDVFSDPDNDVASIVIDVQNNGSGVITAGVTGDSLFIQPNPNASGTAELVLIGNSNGLSARDTLNVLVNPVDDAPTVINPLADISVAINAPERILSLANVFDDIDNDNTAIVKTIANSPDASLLNALIRNDSLVINFQPDINGATRIILNGASNGKSIDDTLNVNIRLPAPFNLSANATSSSQIELNWEYFDQISGISYRLERSLDPDFSTSTFLGLVTGLTFEDMVSQDTVFYYRVRAEQGNNFSTYSNVSAARPVNVPLAPVNLLATLDGQDRVNLNWTNPASDANGFRLERASFLTDNNFIEIASLPDSILAFQDTTLQENLVYSYRLRSFNEFGNSSYSNIAQIQLSIDTLIAPPLAPLNLEAEAVSPEQINLTWDYDLDTTTLFIIERVLGANFLEGQQDTLSITLNDAQQRVKKFSDDQNLVLGNTYSYRIRALNVGGSTASNVDTATVVCNLSGVIAVVRVGNSSGRICEGKSLPLEVVPILTNADYQWLRNGVPIAGANSRRFLSEFTGRYSCIVNVGVCVDTTLINENVVFEGSSPELTIFLDEDILRADQRDAVEYQWFRNFDPIPGADQSFFAPQVNGQYYVIATFGTGPAACKSISNTLIYPPTVTSIEDFDISNLVEISPNPTNGLLGFALELGARGEYQLSFTNTFGQVVKRIQGEKKSSRMEKLINLDDLPSGMYLLKIRLGKLIGQVKIMKQ